ncbi:hypothetical protein GCM10023332_19630 [Luteimonas vadosa]|uniref:Uncharacterized protein n=1 Tax=Luteimonas vadosa TaxID=1165507 RepID=A0ABP9E9V0_9GAMM
MGDVVAQAARVAVAAAMPIMRMFMLGLLGEGRAPVLPVAKAAGLERPTNDHGSRPMSRTIGSDR